MYTEREMVLTTILHHYILWHYSRGFADLAHVWGNLLWFTVHFFSLPQLARSLLAPYKRMVENRGETWSLEDLAGFVIIGILSRIFGFIIRLVIIVVGLIALLLVFLAGLVAFVFWVGAPLIVLALLGTGIRLLFLF